MRLIFTKLHREAYGTYSIFEAFIHAGDLVMCCSDPSADQVANEKASLEMTKTLLADYKITFAKNQAILGNLTDTLNRVIAKPQGFSAEGMAALRTGAMDTTAKQFGMAKSAAAGTAARYGGDVASGVTGQIIGQVGAQEAQTESALQTNISSQNEQLKRANYWAGIQGLTNVAAAYNPTGYAGAQVGSTEATTKANAEILAEQQAGWQNAMGIVSGIAGLGSAAMGGIGALGAMGKVGSVASIPQSQGWTNLGQQVI